MSLFSRLKSLFNAPQSAPVAQPPMAPQPLRPAPRTAEPVVQKAVEKSTVYLSRNTIEIEPGINCDELDGTQCQITELPDELVVRHTLKLENCQNLTSLPNTLSVPSVNLSRCTALQKMPEKMQVTFLNLQGCTKIKALPVDLQMNGGILNLSGCTELEELPDNIGEVAGLNLNGCEKLTALPAGLKVTSWMDITGTQIKSVPNAYLGVGFRNGFAVINAEDALAG